MADFNARVVLSAKNNAGAPLRQLRNDLRGLAESFRGLGRTTGLRDLQRDFVNLGRTVGDIHRRHVLPMMRSVATMAGMLGGLTAGAAMVGLTRSMDGARQSIDDFSKASRKINMPIDELRAYGHVAELAGISTSEFTKGMAQADRTLTQMQKGFGRANSRLKELDPTLRNQMLTAKSSTEAVDHAMQAMHKAIQSGDRGMAAELSATIFGTDMTALAEMSAKEFRQAYEAAFKLIGPIGDEAGLAIENFNDRFDDLKASIQGTRDALATELLPALTGVVEKWTEWLSPNNRTEFVKSIAEPMKAMIGWLKEVDWEKIGTAFKTVMSGVADTVKLIHDNLEGIVTALKILNDPGKWGNEQGQKLRRKIIGPEGKQSGETREQSMDSWLDGLPRRAGGGRLAAGQTSIVGEKGIELFRPDRAGTVIPNHRLKAEAEAGSEVLTAIADLIDSSEDTRKAIRSLRTARLPQSPGYNTEAKRAQAIRELTQAMNRGDDRTSVSAQIRKEVALIALAASGSDRILSGLKSVLGRVETLFKSMPLGAGFGPMGAASSLGGYSAAPASYSAVRDAVRSGSIALPGGAGARAGRPGGAPGRTPGKGFFEAIIAAEGTAVKGDPYEEVLGYGAYGRPDKPLTGMTLNEVKEFGLSMRRAQAARGKPWNKTSSASGAFQIVGTTMMDAARALGMDPATTKFDQATQQRMASWIAQRQGLGAWEGFKHHPQQRAAAAAAMAAGQAVPGGGLANLVPGYGRQDVTDFLSSKAPGKDLSHVTGFDPDFASRMAAMIKDAPQGVSIFSGYRSPERQQELWQNAVRKYGSEAAARKWVAPPGKSMHNSGTAADLGFGGGAFKSMPADVRQWLHTNAPKYGLKFPLGHEPWHIEKQETRGGEAFNDPRERSFARSLRPNMNRRSFTPATRDQGYRAAEVPATRVEVGKGALDIRLSLPDGVGVSNIGVKQPENLTANVGVDRTGAFRPPTGTKTGMRGPT